MHNQLLFIRSMLIMKQILTFSAVLFTLLFLLFSDTDRRIQIFTELAGPGMLSLLKQSSIPADSEALESPRIALTFDDGPNARYTPLLLDGLRERNIQASFFVIGENIEGNEDILQQMQTDGHLIGNHTWDHVQLNKIPAQKARMEIEKPITGSMKPQGSTLLTYAHLSVHGSKIWNYPWICCPYSGMWTLLTGKARMSAVSSLLRRKKSMMIPLSLCMTVTRPL